MIRVLVTDAEQKAIEATAKAKSLDVSTWIRMTILEAVGSKK